MQDERRYMRVRGTGGGTSSSLQTDLYSRGEGEGGGGGGSSPASRWTEPKSALRIFIKKYFHNKSIDNDKSDPPAHLIPIFLRSLFTLADPVKCLPQTRFVNLIVGGQRGQKYFFYHLF